MVVTRAPAACSVASFRLVFVPEPPSKTAVLQWFTQARRRTAAAFEVLETLPALELLFGWRSSLKRHRKPVLVGVVLPAS
jgi:hypothetical protein